MAVKLKGKPTGKEAYVQNGFISEHKAKGSYEIQYKTHQGRTFIVVPTVMMRTGVHCGSNGPIFHQAEELGKIVQAWNGIPVTIGHPTDDGSPISANSPEVVDEKVVGRVYNAFMDGDKLKAECWLDELLLQERSPKAYTYIKDKWPLDVSVGVFTEDIEEEGVWNGEEYTAIATNYRPDHLALLPGSVGACSWADGCGIRNNQEGRKNDVNLQELLKELHEAGFSAYKSGVSHEIIREQLYNFISGKAGKEGWTSLEQVFDDYFVYQVVTFSQDGPTKEALYKQEYSVGKEGTVELNGNPSLVRRKVDYVSMEMKRGKGGKGKMEKKTKINMLIQSSISPFEEGHREFLEGLDDSQLEAFAEKFKEPEKTPVVNASPEPETKPIQVDHLQALRDSIKSEEDFLAVLPEGPMKDSIRSGIELNNARKSELVARIMENSKEFTAEELNEKSVKELGKLASLIPVKVNYAPMGNGSSRVEDSPVPVLMPCGVTKAPDKK